MACVRVPLSPLFAAVTLLSVAGCAGVPFHTAMETDERQCLARVMYFESLRSSDDGMLAVGTVVMNRIASGRYPRTICGTVGQSNQFAPGALTSPMDGVGTTRALRMADAVIAGQRHPGMEGVMFFHTVGYSFPYHNMRYVLIAGGNAFYYKSNDPEEPRQAYVREQAALPMRETLRAPAQNLVASALPPPRRQVPDPEPRQDEAPAKPAVMETADFQSVY